MECLCLEILGEICCASAFITAFLVEPLVKELAVRFLKYHHKRWQNIRVCPCQWKAIRELGEQTL